MQGNFTKESWQFQMMSDYYNLIKNYWEIENKDDYWKNLVLAAEEFGAKYDSLSKGFSRKISLDYLNYLESKFNEQKEN